jgi:hypothetical protein
VFVFVSNAVFEREFAAAAAATTMMIVVVLFGCCLLVLLPLRLLFCFALMMAV